jgi:hypothetical protein
MPRCTVSLVLAWTGAASPPPRSAPADTGQPALGPVTPVLQKYCVSCHSGTKPKGNLVLDQLSSDFGTNGAAWNGVLERLNDHTMPPKGKPQPSDAKPRS